MLNDMRRALFRHYFQAVCAQPHGVILRLRRTTRTAAAVRQHFQQFLISHYIDHFHENDAFMVFPPAFSSQLPFLAAFNARQIGMMIAYLFVSTVALIAGGQ